MVLNEKTIKKGTVFYQVRLTAYKKDYLNDSTWHFWFQKAVAEHEPSPLFGVNQYLLEYSIPRQVNTSIEFPYPIYYNNCTIQAFRIEGNKEPIITVSIVKSSDMYDEYVYLCTDIRAAIKALKSKAFKVKGNEATRRRRIRMWKELIRQWRKTQFRDNFYTFLP